MTVSEILAQVRWCVDEESGYQDFEDTCFDNIVKSKIGAAIRWCAMYADPSVLNDGTADGLVKTVLLEANGSRLDNFALPADMLRLIRVRASSWKKAVMNYISEDSDEYLMQSDAMSCATIDRPVVAIIQKSPVLVEPFPKTEGDDIEYTYVRWPQLDTSDGSSDVPVPYKLESAFVYYLAFLVMAAHSDTTKANTMLAIAKQHLSLTVDE